MTDTPAPLASALIPVGARVTFAKTVTESDIGLFAGITGDFSPNHVNAEYMAGTPYGRPIAHGVLTIGLMSTCSTRILELHRPERPCVSLGYDRVRFLAPVFAGDTITVTYEITEQQPERGRTIAAVEATNQRGETVAAATHILRFL